MRPLAVLLFATIALAGCDAPDPSAFHHALRSDAMTGTHVNGAVGSGEIGGMDTRSVEQMQRQGDINIKK
jgi:hypothetical protein